LQDIVSSTFLSQPAYCFIDDHV